MVRVRAKKSDTTLFCFFASSVVVAPASVGVGGGDAGLLAGCSSGAGVTGLVVILKRLKRENDLGGSMGG